MAGESAHQAFSFTFLWHIVRKQKTNNLVVPQVIHIPGGNLDLVVLQVIHTLRGRLKESAGASVYVCVQLEKYAMNALMTFRRNVSWNREVKGELLNTLVKDLLGSR